MSSNQGNVTIFGGNGYGKGAHWPSTEESFRRLLSNLKDCNFTAVMFDKAALGNNFPSFIQLVKQAGLKWLSDLTDYMQEDGYTYGERTKAIVEETRQEAWGFHIFSQVSSEENARKISVIANAIQGAAPSCPTFATMNPDATSDAVAQALAQHVDVVGTWTTSRYFDASHAAVNSLHWRNILGRTNRRFYFKMTFREGEADFLNRVGNYLVAKSIAEHPQTFAATFWTTYQNQDVFGYTATPGPEATKIKEINAKLVDPWLQSGTAQIGSSTENLLQATVDFPQAFSNVPVILATPLQGTDYTESITDTFAVTVTSVTTTSFEVNVFRVDTIGSGTNGWAQNLQLSWLAA